mmetsp:Transcript_2914/g.4866  ORF Transcript_2914/g.4866 Transcript_2914/m.4866 type:complete len:268 (-) Transcript_2914:650-1453(-)
MCQTVAVQMYLVSRTATRRATRSVLSRRIVSSSAPVAPTGRTVSIIARPAWCATVDRHRTPTVITTSGRRAPTASRASAHVGARTHRTTVHRRATAGTIVIRTTRRSAVVESLRRRAITAAAIRLEARFGLVAPFVSVHRGSTIAVATTGRTTLVGRWVPRILSSVTHVTSATAITTPVTAAHIPRISLPLIASPVAATLRTISTIAAIPRRTTFVAADKASTQLRRTKIHSRSLLVTVISTRLLHTNRATVQIGAVHCRQRLLAIF